VQLRSTRFRGNVFRAALQLNSPSEQGKFGKNAPGCAEYVENADSLLRLG
jgi:hypothetical protein